MTKKDRPPVAPFSIQEAERLISKLHADWGDAIGNYDEFRFFTGLRPSEQIALLVTDYDARRAVLSVTKARVLRRDKDRTKTQEDRNVELCPRALEVLRRHLALRSEYVAAGKIRHEHLFFLEDGRPISDPEITRWRWSESIKTLNVRRRGPYHARHSSVTWQLMLGKNLLWVAKQHGHSVEVMLRMYAAWLEGATDADIHAIKKAMEKRPDARAALLDSRTAISAANAVSNRVTQIVIRRLKSPEFGSSLAVGKDLSDSSLRNDSKIKWRRGWDCCGHPGRSPSGRRYASSQFAPGELVEPGGFVHTSCTANKKGPEKTGPFLLAERVGFEPTCRNYPTIRFRVGAVVTTSVPLQLT